MSTTPTLKQRQLALAAKFYELASQHDIEELRDIRALLRSSNDPSGLRIGVDLLIRLHGAERELSREIPMVPAASRVVPRFMLNREGHDVLKAEKLRPLLENPDLFPKVHDVAKIFPPEFRPRPKESRKRFTDRAIQFVGNMDRADSNRFRSLLLQELDKRPSSFISQWKNLIREL